MIEEMNKNPLNQHILALLLKGNRDTDKMTLYLTQAALLIPQLLEIDPSRPSHQKLIQLLEELPTLNPTLQVSMMMGLHQSSTQNDMEEMTDEMMGIAELDELALLIADNLLGALNR